LRLLDKPKPEVAPLDFGRGTLEKDALVNDDGAGMRNYLKLMFDVIVLALQTDSTRVISHFPKGEGGPVFKDRTKIPHDYHALTHHGQLPEKLEMWARVDQIYMNIGRTFWASSRASRKATARCSTIRWRPGRPQRRRRARPRKSAAHSLRRRRSGNQAPRTSRQEGRDDR